MTHSNLPGVKQSRELDSAEFGPELETAPNSAPWTQKPGPDQEKGSAQSPVYRMVFKPKVRYLEPKFRNI